jgi:hypothetical protein
LYLIDEQYAQIPYLLKEKLAKYLFDEKQSLIFDPFMKMFMPGLADVPFAGQTHPMDLLNHKNDAAFHNQIRSIIQKSLQFHFL